MQAVSQYKNTMQNLNRKNILLSPSLGKAGPRQGITAPAGGTLETEENDQQLALQQSPCTAIGDSQMFTD